MGKQQSPVKGMRRIAIQPITNERNRSIEFLKRKNDLFKKAHELGVLCSVDVAVIIFEERPGHEVKLYRYGSANIDDLVQRSFMHDGERDTRGPQDFWSDANTKLDSLSDGDGDDELPSGSAMRKPLVNKIDYGSGDRLTRPQPLSTDGFPSPSGSHIGTPSSHSRASSEDLIEILSHDGSAPDDSFHLAPESSKKRKFPEPDLSKETRKKMNSGERTSPGLKIEEDLSDEGEENPTMAQSAVNSSGERKRTTKRPLFWSGRLPSTSEPVRSDQSEEPVQEVFFPTILPGFQTGIPEIPPDPLCHEIPLYPLTDFEDIPEVAPNPVGHDIDLFSVEHLTGGIPDTTELGRQIDLELHAVNTHDGSSD